MRKLGGNGLGRNTLQGIVLETAAGIGGGDDTLFHAHNPFLIQNGTSLAIGAARLNILFKQHGCSLLCVIFFSIYDAVTFFYPFFASGAHKEEKIADRPQELPQWRR
jgi:hypothetical protein